MPDEHLGGATGSQVAQVCQVEGRALITLDLDFADIRAFPPKDYSGLIVLRLRRFDKNAVLGSIRRVLSLLQVESLQGKLWVVDEATARIHD